MLERVLGPAELGSCDSIADGPREQSLERDYLNFSSEKHEDSLCLSREPAESATHKEEEHPELGNEVDQCDSTEKEPEFSNGVPPDPVRVVCPKPVPSDLLANLTQLATLYTELSCFRKHGDEKTLERTTFLRRYFFLLDQERVQRMCLLCYREQPQMQSSFIEAMLGQ